MKKILLLVFMMAFLFFAVDAQEITGQWNGVLTVQGVRLRLVFDVVQTSEGLSSTMDSPDQGVKGIPTTTTSFENSILKITLDGPQIAYEGKLGDDQVISGEFRQGGQTFPLNLSKEVLEEKKPSRPQEPQKPFPYYSEDLTFENPNAGIDLAGTLTLPQKEGVFPAVILISGSGPQNRDEELLGHKPFLVISDFLTRNGIAVLRYDDRGTALSEGDFRSATSLDFAEDAKAAVEYLRSRKEIIPTKIGLIGHSEGGVVASMVASKTVDVAFIVLLAGTGIPGDQLLLLQQQLVGKASGMSEENLQKGATINKELFAMVKSSTNLHQLNSDINSFLVETFENDPNPTLPGGMGIEEFAKLQADQIATPWMQFFVKYDPAEALQKVKCPVLAIIGEKDLQVPPKENLSAIHEALKKGGNEQVTTKELPDLNHLFQESTTGSPSEYASIEQTISPTALTEVLSWIQAQVQ
ncbi:alpha/beta hydrolase [Algoriphagus sp.]|uniref:alpha/beta hydrolase family protein n=1 Tax=Algoriphagus sp. TaxID=1872435 RepID=UPI002630AC31|nr:alpha/beta hydrolase [Algoriphagus sp.]